MGTPTFDPTVVCRSSQTCRGTSKWGALTRAPHGGSRKSSSQLTVRHRLVLFPASPPTTPAMRCPARGVDVLAFNLVKLCFNQRQYSRNRNPPKTPERVPHTNAPMMTTTRGGTCPLPIWTAKVTIRTSGSNPTRRVSPQRAPSHPALNSRQTRFILCILVLICLLGTARPFGCRRCSGFRMVLWRRSNTPPRGSDRLHTLRDALDTCGQDEYDNCQRGRCGLQPFDPPRLI
jgi:hypothetical protein